MLLYFHKIINLWRTTAFIAFPLCFGLFSVNAALADQIVDVSPIIVQPYDLKDVREISQRTLEQDRINREQELAMEIHQTMVNYPAPKSQRVSKYHDLIALTEDVDDMKGVGRASPFKSNVIEKKYKILTELKDEMMALNKKLKGEAVHEKFYKTAPQQERKIQMITQRLGEMDQRIARLNESIRWLNQVLAAAKHKAEYYQLTAQEDLLSMQQVQEEAQHIKDDFARIASQLSQKQGQVELLEKNQGVLTDQIQDLKAQLQDKENQITAMKTKIQSGQAAQAQADTLRQQLADQHNKVDLLKQELDSKTAESNKMTLMMEDYQKKLESKNNAYNGQLGQMLSSKNYQAQMEAQIADLNARLQEKEAQVVKIKKDKYDLQELMSAKDTDIQAKDLSLSMIQQKMMDKKINEYKDKINGLQAASDKRVQEIKGLRTDLALARQELKGMPSSDEIDFLREKLKQALDEIDEQGRLIKVLTEKLQERGQK